MADRRNDYPPSVNVGKLYERTSAAGNTYISGFFGSMKITLLKSKDADAEGNPIWNLMIAAAPSRDRAGNQAGRKAEGFGFVREGVKRRSAPSDCSGKTSSSRDTCHESAQSANAR
jgi:hypothetical protein